MAASLISMLDNLESRLERTQAELQALREENQQLKLQLADRNTSERSVPGIEAPDTAFSTEAEIEAQEVKRLEEKQRDTQDKEQHKERQHAAGEAAATETTDASAQPVENVAQSPSSHALLNQWYERYPNAFFKGHTKPLKVGIHQDLAEREQWPNRLIRRALANYVNLPRYIKAVRAGAERVDLDGHAAGNVDKEAAQHASEKRGDQKERGDKKEAVQPKKARPKQQVSNEKNAPKQAAEVKKAAQVAKDEDKGEPRKPVSMEEKLLGLQQKFKGR